ncbi:MAG: ribosome-associated translation inhibitor RaiA [Pirellulaceae bacterium]
MQVNISARHGHLSPPTQQKISEKVEKLQRYFDRVSAIAVTVDLEHREDHHEAIKVEVQVSAERTDDFVATETADELFAALDGALHKVEQQIKKHKERNIDVHRQPGRKNFESP